ncbi:MAG: hypothetical protein JSV26_10990, partial [bacterium]
SHRELCTSEAISGKAFTTEDTERSLSDRTAEGHSNCEGAGGEKSVQSPEASVQRGRWGEGEIGRGGDRYIVLRDK